MPIKPQKLIYYDPETHGVYTLSWIEGDITCPRNHETLFTWSENLDDLELYLPNFRRFKACYSVMRGDLRKAWVHPRQTWVSLPIKKAYGLFFKDQKTIPRILPPKEELGFATYNQNFHKILKKDPKFLAWWKNNLNDTDHWEATYE